MQYQAYGDTKDALATNAIEPATRPALSGPRARRTAARASRRWRRSCLSLLGLPVLALPAAAAAQTKGMVAANDHTVTIFDADTNTVLATLDLPGDGVATGDCSINPDGTRGFVTDFSGAVHVIDLTTNMLAAGLNPIPIANNGEDTSITRDGKYIVVCDGANVADVSVIDVATQAEIGSFPTGADCNSVDVCGDGSVLVTSFTAGEVRRLVIDGAGTLTDTGQSLALGTDGPMNVACAPGSDSGIVINYSTGDIRSFTIPGLSAVHVRALPSSGDSVVISGVSAFTRSIGFSPSLQGWAYDPATGALGATPFFDIPISDASPFFGMDQIGLHPTTGAVYVTEPYELNRYHPGTGALLGTMALPSEEPTGVCFQPVPTCVTIRRGVSGSVRDSDLTPGNGNWAAGAYPYLWTGGAPSTHWALLGFDTSFIPADALVTSAAVSVYGLWSQSFTTVRAHEVLNPWSESAVSWTNFGLAANFDPAVIASFAAGGGSGAKTFDITPLAQAWVDGSADNNGLLLEETAGPSPHAFVASEASTVSQRPKLDICYFR